MRRPSITDLFSALVVAAAGTYVCAAAAGFHYTGNVSVTTTWGTGAAGSARNGTLAKEYVYCTVTGTTAALTAACFAQNAAGTSVSCSTSNANLVEVVKKMSSDSYVQFNFTPSDRQCQNIQVFSGSDYEPKK